MSLVLSEKAKQVKESSTLAITAKAKAMRASGADVVGFGAGEPDFNTPENICMAAIRAILDGFTKYTPASGTPELKQAVCDKLHTFNSLNYEPNQIVVSNGGKHSLTNVFEALVNPGDEVIIPAPYWLTYPEIVRLCGGVPVFVYGTKENNYKVTAEQVAESVTDRTKALIINTPNNPTGMVYTREELQGFADLAVEKDFYVVSDEMYENLIYEGKKHVSIASLGEEIYKRTITCSGLSKSYAMTGWRIGYTASSPEIAKIMGNIQSHQTSNPNSIAQKAAYEALSGDQRGAWDMKVEFEKRRGYMYERLCQMPHISVPKPEGAFYVFVDFSGTLQKKYKGKIIENAQTAADILIREFQTAVVPCQDFGFPDFIRLSYAISMEAIEKGLARIERFLNEIE